MSEQTEAILRADSVHKSYEGKAGSDRLEILNDVSLAIHANTSVAILGSSGSGKSTLLHVLGGLDSVDSGQIFWGDKNITALKPDQLAELRNKKVGFIFQFHHLLPEFTALENVFMPALIGGASLKKAEEKAHALMKRFGIAERAAHRPSELSGGEQQRVSVARALMNNPEIILADEPTGNLDDRNTDNLLDLLFELKEKFGVAIVLVTHEKHVAERADIRYEIAGGTLQTVS